MQEIEEETGSVCGIEDGGSISSCVESVFSVCSQSWASCVVNNSVTVCAPNEASSRTCKRKRVCADMSLGLKLQRIKAGDKTPVVKIGEDTFLIHQESFFLRFAFLRFCVVFLCVCVCVCVCV